MILVLGVPSGGTSCMAGVLRRLGVDMGVLDGPRPRPYDTHECSLCYQEVVHPVWPGLMPNQEPCCMVTRFRQYIARRPPTAGVKVNELVWMGHCPAVADLGLKVIEITRPLDDCLRSVARYAGTGVEVSARMGVMAMARDVFRARVAPEISVAFPALLRKPELWVGRVAAAAGLSPSGEQVASAVRFVNPALTLDMTRSPGGACVHSPEPVCSPP